MGYFITFEGIEGSGKTTQIRKAAGFLAAQRIPCLLTEEPGGTGLGRILRKILLDKTALRIGDRAELLLFAADRAQHVEETILPALREGKVVLCDRFSDATTAYQGFGRGLDRDAVRWLSAFAAGSLKPDRTYLFDISPDEGLERVRMRSSENGTNPPEKDRFEGEEVVFHRRIREGYLALAGEEPDRFRVFRGSDPVDSLHREVVRDLLELLRR